LGGVVGHSTAGCNDVVVAIAAIPSPHSGELHIGPAVVHVYGLMYAIGVLAAVTLTTRLWERRGGRRELVYDVALWGFPAGLIGGRLYFLATSWSEVPAHWWGPFAVWQGGLSIWGGIALGTAVGIWRLRRAGADVAAFMDVAAPGLLVAQAIGRIGNYFNQELFGGPTDLPWALRIDPAHRPPGYAAFTGFHPTFLYELIFDLALAAVLLAVLRRGRIRPPGIFALYVAGYSGFRMFEESLRIDPSHHILGLRLNFYVAAALFTAAIAWFAHTQGHRRALRRGATLIAIGATAATLGACGEAPPHAQAAAVPGAHATETPAAHIAGS
jgi:prolipoprotein diacylglyceryl transferase